MPYNIEIENGGWVFDERIHIPSVSYWRFAGHTDITVSIEIEDEVCAWRI